MKITENSVVTLDYALHLGDGEIVDRSEPGDPLTYLHGVGEIVPGLEQALEGLSPGDSKHVVLAPDDGYGPRDESAVETLPREAFEGAELEEGAELIAVDEDGDEVAMKILKIDGDRVTVDFNHPLAGKTLHFAIQIREVRAATAEEIEHGHAHGSHSHAHA